MNYFWRIFWQNHVAYVTWGTSLSYVCKKISYWGVGACYLVSYDNFPCSIELFQFLIVGPVDPSEFLFSRLFESTELFSSHGFHSC